ncbi:MAG: ethylbenzene dehydrogenase-related protein [Magnetococcus sp. WYHC-3]
MTRRPYPLCASRGLLLALLGLLVPAQAQPVPNAQAVLRAWVTPAPPQVDGRAEPELWRQPEVAVTLADGSLLFLRALHDTRRLYLLVRFPDASADRAMAMDIWDPRAERYRHPQANLDQVLLALWSEKHDVTVPGVVADLWHWDAGQRDQMGTAEDGQIQCSRLPLEGGLHLGDAQGYPFHALLTPDPGTAPLSRQLPTEPGGQPQPRYLTQPPQGSRADVTARGHWSQGFWVVELARDLDTGHAMDLPLAMDARPLLTPALTLADLLSRGAGILEGDITGSVVLILETRAAP